MEEVVEIKNFRNIKNFKEELLDVFNYVSEFLKNHTEKENSVYYESIISHKIDRLCFGIPNFILSVDSFKIINDIFLYVIQLKEDKNLKNYQRNIINEIYQKFKYLMEWCLLYYEETFL